MWDHKKIRTALEVSAVTISLIIIIAIVVEYA